MEKLVGKLYWGVAETRCEQKYPQCKRIFRCSALFGWATIETEATSALQKRPISDKTFI